MKLTTTLARIKTHNPCASGFKTLLEHLGSDYPDDKEIDLLTILESNGMAHFFWAFRAVADQELVNRTAIELAIKFAERALPIFEKGYPDDGRPRVAIYAAKAWLENYEKIANLNEWLIDSVKKAAISVDAAVRAAQAACHAKYIALDISKLEVAAAAACYAAEAACCAAGTGWEADLARDSANWLGELGTKSIAWGEIAEDSTKERQAQIKIIKEVLA